MGAERMDPERRSDRPMCLRVHQFLPIAAEVERGPWRCDGRMCAGGAHDYRLDADCEHRSVDDAIAFGVSRFHVASAPGVTVWSSPGGAELPETTRGLDGGVAVYLTAADREQATYQAGHESFHALFTPVQTHHWLHELLAVMFALEFLHAQGLGEYRQRVINDDDRGARALPLARLVQVDAAPYPPGLYARASVFGRSLARAAGIDALFTARDSWEPATAARPHYWAWVDGLPRSSRRRVEALGVVRAATR